MAEAVKQSHFLAMSITMAHLSRRYPLFMNKILQVPLMSEWHQRMKIEEEQQQQEEESRQHKGWGGL